MKAGINLEFTDDEIKRIGYELLARGSMTVMSHLGRYFTTLDPRVAASLQGLFVQMQAAALSPQVQRAPMPPGWAPPPPWVRPAPAPGPYAPPPEAARVTRMPDTSPVHDKCFAIEETRHMEAGFGCCKRATYNNVSRTACRHCGHARCDAIITPPPASPRQRKKSPPPA